MDSQAIYAQCRIHLLGCTCGLSAGLRYTQDDKTARQRSTVGLIDETQQRDWSETSWDLSANYQLNDRMNVYGTIQSGYQSGQFPPRPFCLFGSVDFADGLDPRRRPNCFVANDNVTALNYEVGLKGQPLDNLQMSIAVFYTDYSDLPYQVSTTLPGAASTPQHHRRPDLAWASSGKAPGRSTDASASTRRSATSTPTWTTRTRPRLPR